MKKRKIDKLLKEIARQIGIPAWLISIPKTVRRSRSRPRYR